MARFPFLLLSSESTQFSSLPVQFIRLPAPTSDSFLVPFLSNDLFDIVCEQKQKQQQQPTITNGMECCFELARIASSARRRDPRVGSCSPRADPSSQLERNPANRNASGPAKCSFSCFFSRSSLHRVGCCCWAWAIACVGAWRPSLIVIWARHPGLARWQLSASNEKRRASDYHRPSSSFGSRMQRNCWLRSRVLFVFM